MTDIVTYRMVSAGLKHVDQRAEGSRCDEMVRDIITAALRAMWLPISEAPTNGSEVLAGFYGQRGEWHQFVGVAYSQGVRARYFEHPPATHFAPLICPPAPEDV